MNKYFNIIKNQVLINFQYRFNFLTNIFLSLFQFMVIFFVWKNIYINTSNDIIANYTNYEMYIYVLITNIMTLIYNFKGIHRLGYLVRTGKLTTILLRPISLIKENLAHYIGNKILIISIFILFIFIFRVNNKGLSLLYILVTMIMHFYLISSISVLGFYILQTWPLHGLFNGIFYILAGVYFPLDLLPENIFNIIKYNPFSLFSFVLAKVVQSKIDDKEIITYLIASIIWSIIFRYLYVIGVKKGLKNYEGMGA